MQNLKISRLNVIQMIDCTLCDVTFDGMYPNEVGSYVEYITALGIGKFEINITMLELFYQQDLLGKCILYITRIDNLEKALVYNIKSIVVTKDLLYQIERSNFQMEKINISVELQVNKCNQFMLYKKELEDIIHCTIEVSEIKIVVSCKVVNEDFYDFVQEVKMLYYVKVNVCVLDDLHLATASSIEIYTQNIDSLCVSFNGYGKRRIACLEEVMLGIQFINNQKPKNSESFRKLPILVELFQRITGEIVQENKAVIGKNIFHCESGIHIKALQKKPETYELFSPELVGRQRKFFIGKHSGVSAIRFKADELGVKMDGIDMQKVLTHVRERSIQNKDNITNDIFMEIVEECR